MKLLEIINKFRGIGLKDVSQVVNGVDKSAKEAKQETLDLSKPKDRAKFVLAERHKNLTHARSLVERAFNVGQYAVAQAALGLHDDILDWFDDAKKS